MDVWCVWVVCSLWRGSFVVVVLSGRPVRSWARGLVGRGLVSLLAIPRRHFSFGSSWLFFYQFVCSMLALWLPL